MNKSFEKRVLDEFNIQPLKSEDVVTKRDISHLPYNVQKYLVYTGSVNKPKAQNVNIEFDAHMYRKPNAKAINAQSVQYNFFAEYTRLFCMNAGKFPLTFTAFHIYSSQVVSFMVKAAGLFNVVNVKGDELAKAETVTFLNDMCIFAPSALLDKRLSWKEIDSSSSEVTLTNDKFKVTAVLYFNECGELVNFISEDRYALQDDGSMKPARWSTPVSDYKDFDGRKIPTTGQTIWHYPEGNFIYGKFKLKRINYNIQK